MTDSNPSEESVPSLAALRGLTDAELDGLAHAHPDNVYYRHERNRRQTERAFRSLKVFDRVLVAVTIVALAAILLALVGVLSRLLR